MHFINQNKAFDNVDVRSDKFTSIAQSYFPILAINIAHEAII